MNVLDRKTLDDVVQRIVKAARPSRIILFGSTARGAMGPDSDVDLLIVQDGADSLDVTARIYDELYGVGVAVDAVVVTPRDIDRFGGSHPLVIKSALREGRVVYEAA